MMYVLVLDMLGHIIRRCLSKALVASATSIVVARGGRAQPNLTTRSWYSVMISILPLELR